MFNADPSSIPQHSVLEGELVPRPAADFMAGATVAVDKRLQDKKIQFYISNRPFSL
jgi:hypothetical protein